MTATATKRWSKDESQILSTLFDSNMADPRFTKAAEIDPIKEMRDEFKDFTAQQFRNNYKTTATNWMAGKAVGGTRFQALNLPDTIENTAGSAGSTNANMAPRTNISVGSYVYKEDEQKWDAVHQSSKSISKGYFREELIIEPPASFDGTEGTYQASFDEDNLVFVLKIAPNPVLNDPHALNSYYKNQYGLITADDSARDQAFRASAKCIRDKWYTYRHKLQWKGKPSEDLGRWWLDYTDIELGGRNFPLLIIQLCSIKPVEVQSQKISMGLKKKPKTTSNN